MHTVQPRTVALAAVILAAVAVAACTSGSKDGPPPGQGRLLVALVDKPTPQVSQIVVNVTRVTAHSVPAGWVTVSPPSVSAATPLQIDLLTLQAPATALALGLVNLPPGKVTQLRLFVTPTGNYVVPASGTAQVPLKVPSGTQSGIKVHGPWEISACAETAITLDFDGKRSIWYHPAQQGAEWILRPVIRTKRVDHAAVGCGPACSETSPCPEGQACVEGECQPPTIPGAVGDPCLEDADCLTLACGPGGTCAPGGANAPCGRDDECVSQICIEGNCTAPPEPVPAGGACLQDSDCLSNSCPEGTCEPGGQGAACGADTDCQEGMACTAGACAAP